jgi:DNA-binding SARP family transcriptional activator
MLEIRVLGELKVVRDGLAVELPASKKTRALVGYLAATGKPHLRESLCDMLFSGPDDPRASLRWCLAKIRPLLDAPTRLVADRERVAIDTNGVAIDLRIAQGEIRGDAATASTEALMRAARRFEGELLLGLDLPDCYRYHEWCTVERAGARNLRLAILGALVERLAASPEEALVYARERLSVDPLVEAAHVDVVRLLTELGRRREALQQCETCRRLFANELGTKPSAALQKARVLLGDPAGKTPSAPPEAPSPPSRVELAPLPVARSPLVGRDAESSAIADATAAAAEGRASVGLFFVGEPGIGKTRLLEELVLAVRSKGGVVLSGRAYEAEMVRPYGAWIDALRSEALGPLSPALQSDLAPLLPELGAAAEASGDRHRLFDAVTRLLGHVAGQGRTVALMLDDIQWFDEASVALFHFVVRALALAPSRVLVAAGARPKELSDNPAAARLVRTLVREGRLKEMRLLPLDESATSSLVRAIGPAVDGTRVFRESAGNPLFAVEMTRALARSDAPLGESLAGIIEDRLGQLEERTRSLLPWAAALGHGFTLGVLERVTRLPPTEILGAVGELEQRSILLASPSAEGYDFVHDLIRAAAYRDVSEPRRRLIHAQIARALDEAPGDAVAGEVAHHAVLGGEGALAARASAAAAERCLRLVANEEAVRIADAGMQYAEPLDRETRVKLQLRFIRVLVLSSRWKTRRDALGKLALRLASEARDLGLFAEAAQGFHNLSVLQHDSGDFDGAHASTRLAEVAGRAADPLSCARQLSKSAQCLAYLDRDMDRADEMAREAMALASQAGNPDLLYLDWADALLRAHRGDYPGALSAFARALLLAQREQEHWAEFECLARMTVVHLERGENRDALRFCAELSVAAGKIGEGSEGPVAEALEAYARSAVGEADAEARLERALTTLREVDVKGMLAKVLVLAAELDLGSGRLDRAEGRASEALGAAEALQRRSLVAEARAVLAGVALARGEREKARAHLRPTEVDVRKPLGLSARARREVTRVAEALGAD